jgi:phenylalanyl-tRNA synthetase beta chain
VPVIRFDIAELERLLRKPVPRPELAKTIPLLGADVEDATGETWAVEFFPNRPDLYTVEGIARALRAWYGVEPGLRRYEVRKGTQSVRVDPSVEKVRPHIVAAFVRGVTITQARLDALIDLQEDLHWGLGARRRRVAIGIHDAKPLAPPFRYQTVALDAIRFVPLADPREMTPRQILADHEKGKAYAHLLEGHLHVPIILDAKDGVVSLPPLINAQRTAVTTATHDVFVDVTGTDRWAVERALNMIVTALAEAGGHIESVEIQTHQGARATPDLTPETRELSVAATNRRLGTDLDAAGVATRLERLGHGARPLDPERVHVEVPAYRADVLHPADLMEDVAIGHGINAFAPLPLRSVTAGAQLPESETSERARTSLTGLGFLETLSLTLSNPRAQYEQMRRPPTRHVDVKNPATEDFTMLRVALLPSLLEILKKNAHRDLPQRLFEVGMVTHVDAHGHVRREGPGTSREGPAGEAEREFGRIVNERRIAGVLIQGRSNFSEMKGIVQALARDLKWNLTIEKVDDPAFVEGRCAGIPERGVFGEIHPAVLDAFGLSHPVSAFELHLARGPGEETRGAR